MDIKKIIQQHKQICSLISEKRIKQSLDILADMMAGSSTGELRDEYEKIVMTYRNMLSYTIEGINDPERNKVYFKLIQSILGLSDRVRQDILSHNSGWNTYWVKQQAEKEQKLSGRTIVETVDDLMFKSELDEWLKLSNELNPNPESEIAKRQPTGRPFPAFSTRDADAPLPSRSTATPTATAAWPAENSIL